MDEMINKQIVIDKIVNLRQELWNRDNVEIKGTEYHTITDIDAELTKLINEIK